MLPATIFWIIAIILFVILEGVTVSLVSVWFAVGAVAALLISFLIHSMIVQVIVFLLVSGITLVLLKPVLSRFMTPNGPQATNYDRIIGQEGVVLRPIVNLRNQGEVKVLGQVWSAVSESGEDIPTGTVVRVERIEGVKVFVTVLPS